MHTKLPAWLRKWLNLIPRLRGLIKPEKMTMRQLVSVAAILAVIAALHPSKNLPLAKVRAFFGFHHRGGWIRGLSPPVRLG
jgi:hypothetical protein